MMSSTLYMIIKTRYKLHKITALDVWQYADEGVITDNEAVTICGPRPKGGNDE